ncbi:FKBP-type peptidyl-prolyl cis-trans isomerase [Rhizomonospora bruguierae]|uniref:FKBP-type peptidyl-prolyl cis-trans isomerase n=1 Tax=Rhizomonospora bruguierae TaxID=1581705 RepID=UPI001BCC73EC|nr:FKBP-type peptidyl-prolyl cis-trans isomerase [Micromonospora sp. NBRC 107566]
MGVDVVSEQETAQPMTKGQKRAAAREAAQRAAAARKRRQSQLGALAGLAVVAILIGVFVAFGPGKGGSPDTASAPGTAATTEAPAGNEAPAATFPPLPPGADPALATKPVVKAGTGNLTKLQVTELIQGTGPAAQAGNQVLVNYVGVTYKTGEEFDSSWSHSQPYPVPLGQGRVIPGWDQGLLGAKVGSRVQLDIPADLAYGENPQNGAPGGALRFVVDILAVQ